MSYVDGSSPKNNNAPLHHLLLLSVREMVMVQWVVIEALLLLLYQEEKNQPTYRPTDRLFSPIDGSPDIYTRSNMCGK